MSQTSPSQIQSGIKLLEGRLLDEIQAISNTFACLLELEEQAKVYGICIDPDPEIHEIMQEIKEMMLKRNPPPATKE